jgi:ParB family transcriptional regulator, chromosome partitioning protein
VKRGGLGRGLSALIPGARDEGGLLEVPLDAILPNPRQPRQQFPQDALEALARSIREVGVLQPVILRSRDRGFELIAGERRLRAARLAGLASIPAVIRETDDDTDALREALIENIHREDLGPLELAAALQELLDDLGATQEVVADRLGFSRSHVANTIRLLSLPADVQRLLAQGRIQAGHARALLGLPDDEARSTLALRVAAEGLSVRQVEDLVKAYIHRAPRRRSGPRPPDPALAEVEEILADHLGTRVHVVMGRRKGRIIVDFGSADDLERIVRAIAGAKSASRDGFARDAGPEGVFRLE